MDEGDLNFRNRELTFKDVAIVVALNVIVYFVVSAIRSTG